MVYEKIVKYCEEHNMSIMAFEQLCGLANGVVGKWNGELNPSLASLNKIVKATGVPITDWLEETK